LGAQLRELGFREVFLQREQLLALAPPVREAFEAEDDADPEAGVEDDLHGFVEE
jgi:hypothetical protein